jgi:ERCC4-type nuclease
MMTRPDVPPALIVYATKPAGKIGVKLSEMGIAILPIEDFEGNVDRYVLSQRVAIERRTGASFLRGIQDKTLFTSAIYLREHFELAVLVLEGGVDGAHTAFHPQAFRGALTAMVLNYGLSVLSTPDASETARVIAMAARQEQFGIPEISLTPKRKAADLPDLQRRVIEMLPGCGMVAARDLLQHFGDVRRIANATEEELRGVRGIGAVKAAEICRVLNAEYEDVGTERDLEDAIESLPELLFDHPVELIARQHHIYTEAGARHVVDLVFFDATADELILVELKLGPLLEEHYHQLRHYLDCAAKSPLVQAYMAQGARVRGVLATLEESGFCPQDDDVTTCIVGRAQTIGVLKGVRKRRLTS